MKTGFVLSNVKVDAFIAKFRPFARSRMGLAAIAFSTGVSLSMAGVSSAWSATAESTPSNALTGSRSDAQPHTESQNQPQNLPPQRGGTLTLLLRSEPTSLVSIATVATPVLSVSAKVTEGLLKYGFDLTPEAQLATSWEVSPDGKTYTFHLRHGVQWQDGKPFTSEDVAFSLKLIQKVHPRGRSTFANLTRVETPDTYTVVLHLSEPAPYLIHAFAATETPIVARHIYENTDALTNANGIAPIGTGPFLFNKWVHGSYIEYDRNPNYWDKSKPYIDHLIIKIVPDAGAASIAFETGAADLGYRTPVSPSDLKRLQGLHNLHFETKGNSYSFNVTRLEFNLDNPNFKNLKVRQAVASAIDRRVIVNVVNYGYGEITYSPIAPGLIAFHDAAVTPYPFDVARADQLLDEAGFPRKADGIRFSVPLDYNPIGDDGLRLAEYLRSALAKIGIAVQVRTQDPASFIKRIYSDRDFALTTNGASDLFDPTVGVQRLYWSKNFIRGVPFSNATHYDNPRVDTLLQDAAKENDVVKRKADFYTFQKIVGEDVPDLNLYQPQFITIANNRVHDDSVTADGVESNLADVWLTSPHQ